MLSIKSEHEIIKIFLPSFLPSGIPYDLLAAQELEEARVVRGRSRAGRLRQVHREGGVGGAEGLRPERQGQEGGALVRRRRRQREDKNSVIEEKRIFGFVSGLILPTVVWIFLPEWSGIVRYVRNKKLNEFFSGILRCC